MMCVKTGIHYIKKVVLLVGITALFSVINPVNTMADRIPGREEVEVAAAFFHRMSDVLDKEKYICVFSATDRIFRDLAEGNVRLAVATEPNEQQKTVLREAGAIIKAVRIFNTPLVVFVNSENGISDLSADEIRNIYAMDEGLVTYQLTDENGSQHCFRSILSDVDVVISDRHKVSENMNSIIEDVGNDVRGIGYAFWEFYRDFSNPELTKIISIDGKSYDESEYELMFPVYLYIRY